MCPRNIKESDVKKILIIGGNNLPDNLLLTPAVKRIKESFPNADMDIIVGHESSDFIFENSLFSQHMIYNKVINLLGLIKKARQKRYDLIVAFRSFYIPFFLRGKFKLSFFWQDLFSEKIFTHESERMLSFLKPFIGMPEGKTNFYFPVSKKNRETVEEYLKSAGIKNSDTLIVVSPGFISSSKRFSNVMYARVIKELIKIYDAKVILTGTTRDKDIVQDIIAMVNNNSVFDFTGTLRLKELTALLEKTDLLITQDLTSIYLACSVQCPIIAVFGPGNSYRYGPLGTKNLVVHSNLDCFPCNINGRCKKNYVCLDKVTPEQITKSAMLLLDEKEQPFLFDL